MKGEGKLTFLCGKLYKNLTLERKPATISHHITSPFLFFSGKKSALTIISIEYNHARRAISEILHDVCVLPNGE